MITFGENAERILAQAANPCRICVSMNLQNDANYFEKLPLLSVILKRVVSEYPDVVFTLYRMSCQNHIYGDKEGLDERRKDQAGV